MKPGDRVTSSEDPENKRDSLSKKAYGIKLAKRLGAGIIQVQPNQFSMVNEQISISNNTTLTFIGHCSNGSNHLSDNAGNRIYASELAEQIYLKMSKTGTPLDTTFTIDLIACQAASPYKGRPSFAERLIKELSKRGIHNASVIASPTIMMTTEDGSQANLSHEDDYKLTEKMHGREQHDTKNLFSSTKSFFTKRPKPSSNLNVDKVTFRSNGLVR